jgi:hypothetical protein
MYRFLCSSSHILLQVAALNSELYHIKYEGVTYKGTEVREGGKDNRQERNDAPLNFNGLSNVLHV